MWQVPLYKKEKNRSHTLALKAGEVWYLISNTVGLNQKYASLVGEALNLHLCLIIKIGKCFISVRCYVNMKNFVNKYFLSPSTSCPK